MKLNSDDIPGGAAAAIAGDQPIEGPNGVDDLTNQHRADELRDQAARCRRLASSALDRKTLDALNGIARECEDEVARLGRVN